MMPRCRSCIFARAHGPDAVICFNAEALHPDHADTIDQRFYALNDHSCERFAPRVIQKDEPK